MQVGRLLGSGAFGDVYHGTYQDLLHPVAIKMIRKVPCVCVRVRVRACACVRA